jgi:hypothetical protein
MDVNKIHKAPYKGLFYLNSSWSLGWRFFGSFLTLSHFTLGMHASFTIFLLGS